MNVSILTSEIRTEHDVMLIRQRVRQLARLLGFEMPDQTRIATAVSEIARNAVQYAGSGRVEFRLTGDTPQLFEIIVRDSGAGIDDLDDILLSKGAYSDRGQSLRGVQRLVDEFHIVSGPESGTFVTLGKQRCRHHTPITVTDIGRIMSELTQLVSNDPVAEIQRQNQEELLRTLDELKRQQEASVEQLKEIEWLNQRLRRAMTETHHRVKNNLQVIAALIDMQTSGSKDTITASELARLRQSVDALNVIHEILTWEAKASGADDELGSVSALEVFTKLLPLLEQTVGDRSLRYTLEDARLSDKQITSLAIVANELVSNAVKHGKGDVELHLRVINCTATLLVSDNGPGFSASFNPIKSSNTGLELIGSIVLNRDLQGESSYLNRETGGGQVKVTFPLTHVIE